MTGIALALVAGGFLTIFLMPVIAKRSRIAAYASMVIIPICVLIIYLNISQTLTQSTAEPSAQQLEQSYKAEPSDLKSALDFAGYKVEQERYEQALAILQQSETHHPSHPDIALQRTATIFARGLYEAENKNYEKALNSLWQARAGAPEGTPFIADLDYFITIISRAHDESRGRVFEEEEEESKPEEN